MVSSSSSSSSSPAERSWKDNLKHSYNVGMKDFVQPAVSSFSQLSNEARTSLTVVATVMLTLAGSRAYKRFVRRIPTTEDVPSHYIRDKKWIKGVVTSVGDADNFRLYHTPGIGWRWPLKFRFVPKTAKELRQQTIHIRLAGVDAPEASHFGRPAQPYSGEALAWLQNEVEGKQVWCQLLLRDQYKRIVAVPLTKSIIPFRYNCVSLSMLKAGWATVYEQSYGEYGKWGKEHFLSILAEAQSARRGMWAQGTDVETPAEYKRRYAATTRT